MQFPPRPGPGPTPSWGRVFLGGSRGAECQANPVSFQEISGLCWSGEVVAENCLPDNLLVNQIPALSAPCKCFLLHQKPSDNQYGTSKTGKANRCR